MFADSLLETSWAYRGRRSWTTLTSFGLQIAVVAVLLLIPLLTTVGLPTSRTVSTPIGAFRRNPEAAPRTPPGRIRQVQIVPYSGRLMAPGRVPDRIANNDGPSVPSAGPGDPGIYVGPGVDSGPGIPLPTTGTRPVIPVPPPTVTRA